MTTYLLSLYQPEGSLPPEDLVPIQAGLDAFNADLKAQGS